MTAQELDSVRGAVENEGFDYAFWHYSMFPAVKDEKFHELRQAYRDARQKLGSYIGEND